MVQEELGDGQQHPCPGWVCAEARELCLQAGQGAVQEGGVLLAEHVQHQHGLHQALWGQGTRGWVELGSPVHPRCPARPVLTAFCRSESPFLRAPAGGRESTDLCVSIRTVNEGRTIWKLDKVVSHLGAESSPRADRFGQKPCGLGTASVHCGAPLPGAYVWKQKDSLGKRGCPGLFPTSSLGRGLEGAGRGLERGRGTAPGTHAECSAPPGAGSTQRLSPAAAPAGAAGGRPWSWQTARTAWSPPAPTCRLEKRTRCFKGAQASASGGEKSYRGRPH